MLESFQGNSGKNDYDITFVNRNRGTAQENDLSGACPIQRASTAWSSPSVDFEDPEVAQLVASDIPVVTIDHIFNNRIAVMSDNVKGMQSLLRYIYSCGHRRIALYPRASLFGYRQPSVFLYKTAEELGSIGA